MGIRRRGWHGSATAGGCRSVSPIGVRPTGNCGSFPHSPQGFPQISGPYGSAFFSFRLFQLVTVFVSISEWTEIKVVVTDYDSKKPVRGLAQAAEIPWYDWVLSSGGHVREWHTPLISSPYWQLFV